MSQRNTVPSEARHSPSADGEPPPQAVPLPRWNSRVLVAGGREAEIEHEQVVYRLRITSLGKLILTK